MTLLSPGDRVSDTLIVDRLLGEGAFAEVHRVAHRYLGWQAMKLFKAASATETRALLGEARLLSTLGHPNIIRLFEAGTVRTGQGPRGFFTMEYVPGGSLQRLAAAHHPTVPTDLVGEVLVQIADGLAVAHGQDPPIVHRDVTLSNILVGYDGEGMRVRVSDFGLAERTHAVTRRGRPPGTDGFIAPEALRNKGHVCASDVWSVGTIGYLLLTNHFPFDDGAGSSLHAVDRFDTPLLPPSSYNVTVDRELDRIVMAALEVDPGNRPATARILADALRTRQARIARPLPAPSPADGDSTDPPPTNRARRLADEARAMSRVPGGLDHAADLMEEAVNLSPRIRELHLPTLLRWRRGVVM